MLSSLVETIACALGLLSCALRRMCAIHIFVTWPICANATSFHHRLLPRKDTSSLFDDLLASRALFLLSHRLVFLVSMIPTRVPCKIAHCALVPISRVLWPGCGLPVTQGTQAFRIPAAEKVKSKRQSINHRNEQEELLA